MDRDGKHDGQVMCVAEIVPIKPKSFQQMFQEYIDEVLEKKMAVYLELTKNGFGVNMNTEKRHCYKLTILYDNGKKFVVNGVYNHSFKYKGDSNQRELLIYSRYDKQSKADINVKVPAVDIAAITVKKPNSVYTERFKPCAVISGGAEKRVNNNQQLKVK